MAATATVPAHLQPVIERASATDRAILAMDVGDVPEQLAVILVLEQAGGLDVQRVRGLIARRLPAIPRLRQRLVRVPFGCGGPVWADDPRFDIGRHVRAVPCPGPGDERALLDIALPLITTRLPLTAPLWAATLVTGLAGGRAGLVIVLHHAMADGVGGLAVLASLVDGAPDAPPAGYPRPAPATAALAREAFAARLRALRQIGQSWQLLRAWMAARDKDLEVVDAARLARQALLKLPGAETGDAFASAVILVGSPDRMAVYDYHAHLGLWRAGLRLDEGPGLYYRYMGLVERCRAELLAHGYGGWTAREVDLALLTHGQQRGIPRPRPWRHR